MALRWCILLAVLGYACAQEGSGEPMGEDLAMRYDRVEAVTARNLRHYCQDVGSDETNFPQINEQAARETTWFLFIQYPVLSYLDSIRKDILISQIVALVNRGSPNIDPPLNASNVCIGLKVQYEVTFYRESLLLNIYFRGDSRTPEQIADISQAFRSAYASGNADIVATFLNTRAIIVNPFNESINGIAMNAHPGSVELPDDRDPTMRAVVVNSIHGSAFTIEDVTVFDGEEVETEVFIEELLTGTYTGVRPVADFAENPNPINYFLEPGDIVFIVFGVIFLFLLIVLIFTGFCIHPFFFG